MTSITEKKSVLRGAIQDRRHALNIIRIAGVIVFVLHLLQYLRYGHPVVIFVSLCAVIMALLNSRLAAFALLVWVFFSFLWESLRALERILDGRTPFILWEAVSLLVALWLIVRAVKSIIFIRKYDSESLERVGEIFK